MSEENCEPYYLLHRIKVLESSYNEMCKFIDEIFEEIEQLKKKRTESDREKIIDEVKHQTNWVLCYQWIIFILTIIIVYSIVD